MQHNGPSFVSVDTLAHTLRGCGGTLTPELRTFFRGAGVPDTLLEYLPGLFEANPLQFYTCFISFAFADMEFSDQLKEELVKAGITTWKYDYDAVMGRGVWDNIDRAIHTHDKVILIASEQSLQSSPVLCEVERALQREDELKRRQRDNRHLTIDTEVLFPIRIDDDIFNGWEHSRQADVLAKDVGDFTTWRAKDARYRQELERLIRSLNPKSWPLGK